MGKENCPPLYIPKEDIVDGKCNCTYSIPDPWSDGMIVVSMQCNV